MAVVHFNLCTAENRIGNWLVQLETSVHRQIIYAKKLKPVYHLTKDVDFPPIIQRMLSKTAE
jgi:hypothetical protein